MAHPLVVEQERVALWDRHPDQINGEVMVSGTDDGPTLVRATPEVGRALATSGDRGTIPPRLVEVTGADLAAAQAEAKKRRESRQQNRIAAIQAQARSDAETDEVRNVARGGPSRAELEHRLAEVEARLNRVLDQTRAAPAATPAAPAADATPADPADPAATTRRGKSA